MLVVSMYVPILMLSTYAVFHNYGHVVTLGYRYHLDTGTPSYQLNDTLFG
jgi:hypothetical protein